MWKVRFFFMPQRSAISFKYELIRWLLIIGKTSPFSIDVVVLSYNGKWNIQ